MALSREDAEANGLAFTQEGVTYPSSPDIEHHAADLTIDGHTEHLEGKSEEDVLLAAERILRARGRISTSAPTSQTVATTDSDLHDQRTDNDAPAA